MCLQVYMCVHMYVVARPHLSLSLSQTPTHTNIQQDVYVNQKKDT